MRRRFSFVVVVVINSENNLLISKGQNQEFEALLVDLDRRVLLAEKQMLALKQQIKKEQEAAQKAEVFEPLLKEVEKKEKKFNGRLSLSLAL